MSADLPLDRARELWTELAATPVEFRSPEGVSVVVSPDSRLCPPSWAGIVVLGDAGVITAPNVCVAELMAGAARKLSPGELVVAGRLMATLPVAEVMGLAFLSYLDRARFRPASGGAVVEEVPGGGLTVGQEGGGELTALLAGAGEEDAEESALAGITSPAFVVRDGGDVVAAAGYRAWPGSVAHLCVMVAPDFRGRGPARVVASAAVGRALDSGMFPQWRPRPHPSRRVALALGFEELGARLSIRLRDNATPGARVRECASGR
ncbi:GNAT family N-acetyltransferase [Streptomyces sp. NPDC088124]|uniref:GNAT family N-acetyltransferase n=1 Tax=Streptomyces sp. NPDC088124 TaxID=3154654 RepID=UPI00343F807B